MALTLTLLAGEYILLIAVFVAAGAGAVVVAVLATGLFLVQYFTSGRIALAAIGAREVDGEPATRPHELLERLCAGADLPMPRLALLDAPAPNAFAIGRSPANATVGVTTGLVDLLDDAELESVLAHELSHIANRDMMVMTIAGFCASLAAAIAVLGRRLERHLSHPDDERDDEAPGFFLVVIASGLMYLLSYGLIQALSRDRELAADRGAALITGRPDALRSALQKISEELEALPQRDLRVTPGELAAFLIAAPDVTETVATMFATHPPLAVRRRALAEMESMATPEVGAR